MTFERMLERHEKELFEFSNAMNKEWARLSWDSKTTDADRAKFSETWGKRYKRLIDRNYTEAMSKLSDENDKKKWRKVIDDEILKYKDIQTLRDDRDFIKEKLQKLEEAIDKIESLVANHKKKERKR